MKKATKESIKIARHINAWLNEYILSQKSVSNHTLKSYRDTLSLYMKFLQAEKKIDSSKLCPECFGKTYIEDWLKWLMDKRACGAETCNNRLAALRAFLSYLAAEEVDLMHLYFDVSKNEFSPH